MAGCNLAKVNFLKKNIQILKFRKFEYYQMCLYMHCFFFTYFSFDNNFNIISNTRGQLSNPHSQVKIISNLQEKKTCSFSQNLHINKFNTRPTKLYSL